MDYNVLLAAYNEMLIENKKLREENDELKQKLGFQNTMELTLGFSLRKAYLLILPENSEAVF